MLNRIETFEDLLKLQRKLDETIAKPRENFTPRERIESDILYAMDDEVQEWLKELPQVCNFKTWKHKEYDREKELEELTDILFFILQLAIYNNELIKDYKYYFNHWKEKNYWDEVESIILRDTLVRNFKLNIYIKTRNKDLLKNYILICSSRDFKKQEILNKYLEKWRKNMTRIDEDWSLKGAGK